MKSFLQKIKKSNWVTIVVIALIYLGNVFCSAFNSEPKHKSENGYTGSEACRSCHKAIYDSFVQTAHNLTSAPAAKEYIKGSFDSGSNIYTYNKFMYVEMDQVDDSFYQTSMINGVPFETAPFDIVIGSARKGQTYLYWNGEKLYQLPVSYYAAQNSWCNSPGYPSTLTKFDRLINAQCLECHSTFAKASVVNKETLFDGHEIIYGVQCERCHGPGEQHVNYFTMHPKEKISKFITDAKYLSRQQQLDACALCHSGLRKETQPAFTFAVGDTLDNYSIPNYNTDSTAMLDVHGNQYGLLTASKCFKMSQMNCSSCHAVHANEYGDVKIFSQRCMTCHNATTHDTCTLKERAGLVLSNNCIDCHMPLQPSKKIFLQLADRSKSTADFVRTHKVAVYLPETKNYILTSAIKSTIILQSKFYRMRIQFLMAALLIIGITSLAQQHNYNNSYVKPTDTLVQQKIEQWQDLKFGLFMHWGTYSEWGVVESWSICPEDEGWTQRRGLYSASYNEYVKAYENLQTTFNPVNFNPDKWAAAAKDAGMKYVVFTTKHHDGFCMFDTKQTDYKVTSSKTPFSSNPNANVAKVIFDAFRKDGFLTGAYFSKPDWHSPDYWWPYFPPKDRNVNYDPAKYPERWKAFKDYTYNQIQELMTGYGKMDILWLDGGWVRPLSSIDTSVEWQRGIKYDQDIDMKRIATMARSYQPGLMVVDRTVSGEFENYVTPEQTVPKEPLPYPWESCITMGNSWSYVPNDTYKSTNTIIHLLLRIVSRGGNLLLNIGPSPMGDYSDTAYSRLKEIGAWMKVHGEAVYKTIPLAPYEEGNILYLQSKDKKTMFIYVLSDDKTDDVVLPAAINLKNIVLNKKSKIVCLDVPGEKINFQTKNGITGLMVPSKMQNKIAGRYAVAFKIMP